MILNSDAVASLLGGQEQSDDPLEIAPRPDLGFLKQTGAASIDLRLGTWFVSTRTSKHTVLDVSEDETKQPTEYQMTLKHYVRFGERFILHPQSFVLAGTLEWIRMPRSLAGYITGKSSWGRRGLVIETAPGVHPGFVGCLTLELANVGEIPIAISPGTPICQLFLHRVEGDSSRVDQSSFVGRRQPVLGKVKLDEFARRLSRPAH
jgi:dCTP deaminase